ncbi:MAG: MSCRAMM family protein, partial [Gemmatimonadales bacterium]
TYTVTGLPAGNYIVSFQSNGFCPNGSASNWTTQWWNNKPDQSKADMVSVTAGETTGSIDAALQPGGSISGAVTAVEGGGPLGGICVSASTPEGMWVNGANTGMDGAYTITGLAAGDYLVNFSVGCGNSGNYVSQWYDNKPDQSTANPVSVTAGETTGSIDAAMQPSGSISGMVTADGGGPLAGICVNVSLIDGTGLASAATSEDGSYTVTGLPPGDVVVGFDSSGFCMNGTPSNYIQQWYNNQPDPFTADAVSVTAGETTGSIDAVLQPGGSISGTVTSSGGDPLGGICVSLFPAGGGFGGVGTATASDGSYTLGGLQTGSYTVSFSSGCGNPGQWAAQWYDGQPSQDAATAVPVTVGENTGLIDAVMQLGGSMSGTVTASAGGGLGGMCVNVMTLSGGW